MNAHAVPATLAQKAVVHQRRGDAADENLVSLTVGSLEREVDRLRNLLVLERK